MDTPSPWKGISCIHDPVPKNGSSGLRFENEKIGVKLGKVRVWKVVFITNGGGLVEVWTMTDPLSIIILNTLAWKKTWESGTIQTTSSTEWVGIEGSGSFTYKSLVSVHTKECSGSDYPARTIPRGRSPPEPTRTRIQTPVDRVTDVRPTRHYRSPLCWVLRDVPESRGSSDQIR